MAGFHKDFESYFNGGGQALIPGSKLPRAYAEGYHAYRLGLPDTDNPHGAPIDNVDDAARAWDQGWRDGEAGAPPTHVGGPTATPGRAGPGVRTPIRGAMPLQQPLRGAAAPSRPRGKGK